MQVDNNKKVYSNLIKDGVIFKLKKNDLFKFEGGLVNRHKIKSFYYAISSHVEVDSYTPIKELKLFAKNIKKIVYKHTSSSPNILPNNIVIFDYPEIMEETGRGYFKLEFNFFNKEMDRKQINSFLNLLTSKVESEVEVLPHIKLKSKKEYRKRV